MAMTTTDLLQEIRELEEERKPKTPMEEETMEVMKNLLMETAVLQKELETARALRKAAEMDVAVLVWTLMGMIPREDPPEGLKTGMTRTVNLLLTDAKEMMTLLSMTPAQKPTMETLEKALKKAMEKINKTT
jgi:hypothetical protein